MREDIAGLPSLPGVDSSFVRRRRGGDEDDSERPGPSSRAQLAHANRRDRDCCCEMNLCAVLVVVLGCADALRVAPSAVRRAPAPRMGRYADDVDRRLSAGGSAAASAPSGAREEEAAAAATSSARAA